MIIASNLVDAQEEKLLEGLREYKEVIGWTIEDIKRINPSMVMYDKSQILHIWTP